MVLLVAALAGGCGSSSSANAPAPPRLTAVEKMAGSLHVSWVNDARSCDAIDVERRSTTPAGVLKTEYAVVYTLPGAADNKHDSSASEDLTYSYRLRCKVGETYSPYSNELGANPK